MLRDTISTIGIVAILYILYASLTFQYLNPTANAVSIIVHFDDMLQLKKLDKFQGK